MSNRTIDTVQRGVDWLYGAISMRLNALSYRNADDRMILLVEGATDEQFIKQFLSKNVFCVIGDGSLVGDPPNVKESILAIIHGVESFKPLLRLNAKWDKVKVFGMVDRDYDLPVSYEREKCLFATDTHDLETLVVSTDRDVFGRISGCAIPEHDVKKALFMAYQIGLLVGVFRDHGIAVRSILSAHSEVAYSEMFLPDWRISLRKTLSYATGKKAVNSAKFKKSIEQLARDKRLRRNLGEDLCWKYGFDDFDEGAVEDMWDNINGHDILSLLRYLNADVANRFQPNAFFRESGHPDRAFEMALINAYKKGNFTSTRMFAKMNDAGVLAS